MLRFDKVPKQLKIARCSSFSCQKVIEKEFDRDQNLSCGKLDYLC